MINLYKSKRVQFERYDGFGLGFGYMDRELMFAFVFWQLVIKF